MTTNRDTRVRDAHHWTGATHEWVCLDCHACCDHNTPCGNHGTCRTPTNSGTYYDRDVLLQVLIYHQRKNITYCACGWSELGGSHAAHIADVYEDSLAARLGATP